MSESYYDGSQTKKQFTGKGTMKFQGKKTPDFYKNNDRLFKDIPKTSG